MHLRELFGPQITNGHHFRTWRLRKLRAKFRGLGNRTRYNQFLSLLFS